MKKYKICVLLLLITQACADLELTERKHSYALESCQTDDSVIIWTGEFWATCQQLGI